MQYYMSHIPCKHTHATVNGLNAHMPCACAADTCSTRLKTCYERAGESICIRLRIAGPYAAPERVNARALVRHIIVCLYVYAYIYIYIHTHMYIHTYTDIDTRIYSTHNITYIYIYSEREIS